MRFVHQAPKCLLVLQTLLQHTRFILSVFFYLERKQRIIYNIFMGIMILSAIQSQWYISVCHKFLSRMNLCSHILNHTWIAFDEERSALLSLSMKDISIRQYWNKEQNSCRSSTLDFYMISFFEWKRHQYTK